MEVRDIKEVYSLATQASLSTS